MEPGPALHGSLGSPTCEALQDSPWSPKGRSSHITGPVPGTGGGGIPGTAPSFPYDGEGAPALENPEVSWGS